jgi:hypothetical protein
MTVLAFKLRGDCPVGPQPMADLGILVRQMAKGTGRQAAFRELYGRLYGLVFDYAGWVLADPEAADRVARGAFVEAWHRARYYRATEGGVEGWILAIAHSRIGEAGRMRRQIPAAAPHLPVAHPSPGDHSAGQCGTAGCHDEHIAVELAGLLMPRPISLRPRSAERGPRVSRRTVRRVPPTDELH